MNEIVAYIEFNRDTGVRRFYIASPIVDFKIDYATVCLVEKDKILELNNPRNMRVSYKKAEKVELFQPQLISSSSLMFRRDEYDVIGDEPKSYHNFFVTTPSLKPHKYNHTMIAEYEYTSEKAFFDFDCRITQVKYISWDYTVYTCSEEEFDMIMKQRTIDRYKLSTLLWEQEYFSKNKR